MGTKKHRIIEKNNKCNLIDNSRVRIITNTKITFFMFISFGSLLLVSISVA